jgi:elongation factor G
METVVPNDHIGYIMRDINSKWGKIQGIDPGGYTRTILAYVPMAEVLTYAADMNFMTRGEGMFFMTHEHYVGS